MRFQQNRSVRRRGKEAVDVSCALNWFLNGVQAEVHPVVFILCERKPCPYGGQTLTVERIGFHGIQCLFRSEDRRRCGNLASLAVQTPEALAQAVERGELGEKRIEVVVGPDLDALGGDQDELRYIFGGHT